MHCADPFLILDQPTHRLMYFWIIAVNLIKVRRLDIETEECSAQDPKAKQRVTFRGTIRSRN